ncbi:glycosyltransferase family 4 protein [Sphingosinicella sp. LHD-64]|uniref:glycosyltransferase family 4 protein n=1 Tax=Sphingosinicella sp. LHD-64 TaxID=3072139 RepID=UPI00280C745D|nr:glycosyltransferase family 4 protein [Sphingosinicella sp. LHD-64]MDQ8757225.1 glycosyltransferase family 4 protein [Sphingosinicella sp. LHD-64]
MTQEAGAFCSSAEPTGSIAIITNNAYSLANFRGPLISDMVKQGLRVYALAPDFDDKTRTRARELGAEPVDYTLERASIRPFRDIRDAVRLAFLLRRLKPDIVLSYFIKPVIYGSLAAWAARVKRRYALVAGLGYVFAPHQGRLKRKMLQVFVSRFYALAFRTCHRIFFQNAEDVAHFVDVGLLPMDKAVRLNGTGVDLKRFACAPAVPQPVRFLLMARLLREKGIEEFVEAGRLVRQSHPEAEFVLLGGFDPNPGGLSEAEVRGWAAEGAVRWLGHVDDVMPEIRASSVYVLPSYYREGVPRSTQEAMAMGRPVITTDWIGCRDTVQDGINGFLVPIRDIPALAAAMTRFVDDPSLIERMGLESRKLAEARFDAAEINAEMLRVMGIARMLPSAEREGNDFLGL